jgi:hypothetical protein
MRRKRTCLCTFPPKTRIQNKNKIPQMRNFVTVVVHSFHTWGKMQHAVARAQRKRKHLLLLQGYGREEWQWSVQIKQMGKEYRKMEATRVGIKGIEE